MSEELKPCPFCGSEAGLSKGGRALCSNEGCIACDLFAPVEDWNRRAQPAEAEGVEVVGVVCISHFKNNPAVENVEFHLAADLPQGQHEVILHSSHLAALSVVTAERYRLQAALDDPGYQPKHARRLIAQLRAEVEALREAFGECIQSLHDEMLQPYGGQKPDDMHPVTRRNYDRDMAEIAEYRAAMAAKEAKA
ncbi:hypothetical protein vBPaeMUSP18_05 [Pseudomonas phage vB_PaeM_USP_18]|nr:hypothetical protein vBPaeMUSP18_05 [Pseudomonas phage vB_PaeM_USP_18]QLI49495.1 hypothetical protein vBPaeMUSP25_05 [Pseudomonas phage vB_PaeM_USP_25]